ncbi:UDP-glucuronosyltransferase 1-6 [Amphibalanus amphitrite]|uniref:UDP-glucuronosyltransferase 1-6 n=1 Tax=Amphibalanus amphitrite TaxID=1232801 RepID=A0A6A4V6X4_AMPAM|nr:UDP-glucuronosyltransferase 1-6 [Amphibalanus amphitrite]
MMTFLRATACALTALAVLSLPAALSAADAAAAKHVVLVTTDQEAQLLVAELAQLLAADHRVTAVLYGDSGPEPAPPAATIRLATTESDPGRRLSWLERWERHPLLTPDAVVASRLAGCGALQRTGVLADLRPDLIITTLFLDDACVLALAPDAAVVGLMPSSVGLPWVTQQLGGHYPVSRLPVHGYPLGDGDFYARLGNLWRWWTVTRLTQRQYQVPAAALVGHTDLEAAYERVSAVFVSGDARLQQDVPCDHRLRFLGCIECARFGDLPKDQQSAISTAGLMVIRLDHPYTTLPDSFTATLTEGVTGSPLTPMDLSNVTKEGAPRIIRSSAPASDALAHPRARLLVSECSPASVLLAIHFSVPIICIPFTAGQKMAAARAVALGVATQLDRRQLTADALRSAVTTVTSSAGTRRAVRAWADALRHDAVSPAAQLAHHVRHLLLFERAWRRRPAPTLLQYYCLDVLGTALVSGSVALGTVALLFYWLYRVIAARAQPDKDKVE